MKVPYGIMATMMTYYCHVYWGRIKKNRLRFSIFYTWICWIILSSMCWLRINVGKIQGRKKVAWVGGGDQIGKWGKLYKPMVVFSPISICYEVWIEYNYSPFKRINNTKLQDYCCQNNIPFKTSHVELYGILIYIIILFFISALYSYFCKIIFYE